LVMMCHNKGLPIFRPEDKPADSTSSRRVGCALRARKSPAGERGSSEVNRFSTTGLPPGRSQRHGQDDTGSSIGGATDETPSRAIGFCVGRPTRKSPAEAGLSFNGLWRRARQPGCRAPIPRPENLGDTSRVPWRKLVKYPKPRRGCRRGLVWQYRGGSLPKLAIGQRGSGGRAVHLAINHLVARRSDRFRPGGTRYRIRFRAGQGLYSRPRSYRRPPRPRARR
jgi:hypothetical protein